MFPVGQDDFLAIKNTEFLIRSGHKKAAAIVSDFGRGGFHCGMRDVAMALQ